MIYKYTWAHLQLFAQICGCDDNSSSIGENWIKILEKHQKKTFPFTLWPLTYRTSTLMASPSIISPTISNIKLNHACEMRVKFYRSNEVIVVCFTHIVSEESKRGLPTIDENENCDKMCIFDTLSNVQHNHIETDIENEIENEDVDALVKCGMLTLYKQLKRKVLRQLRKCREQTSDMQVSCIICVGYGIGAAMANFMCMDLSQEFKMEQEFMNVDSPSIVVDCVTFSSPILGNNRYWKEFESLVDGHIDVQHITNKSTSPTKTIIVGQEDQDTILAGTASVNINTYVQEIERKINVK